MVLYLRDLITHCQVIKSRLTEFLVGLSNQVTLDEKGDRIPYYQVVNVVDGEIKIVTQNLDIQNLYSKKLDMKAHEWRFPGGGSQIPPDIPKCGFHDEKCSGEFVG